MSDRSQQVTWKLLGLEPHQRRCLICGRQLTLESWAGYMVIGPGGNEPPLIWCRDCHPPRFADLASG